MTRALALALIVALAAAMVEPLKPFKPWAGIEWCNEFAE
jgi:hypothetical protein